jgi:hypothetical protein
MKTLRLFSWGLFGFFGLGLFAADPDGVWKANTALRHAQRLSVSGLGAAQGISTRDGFLYLYGDTGRSGGIIREYGEDFRPTGRLVRLTYHGRPLLYHPTGLTFDARWGTFIGDTVHQTSRFFRIDWYRAWREGSLDHAVRQVIMDDAAHNGGRPLFIHHFGVTYLASADYGDGPAALRLYDIARLLARGYSSSPGVVVGRWDIGGYNQNLVWNECLHEITAVQNIVGGLGWRLRTISLERRRLIRDRVFLPHSELEGFLPLEDGRGVFVTSGGNGNVTVGYPQPMIPAASLPGDRRLTP